MPSALTKRWELRDRVIQTHLKDPDLIHYVDQVPRVTVTGALICDGKVIKADEAKVITHRIPGNNLKLNCLVGIGDAVWTRAIVKETIARGIDVYLDTLFRWMFWDLEGKPHMHFWSDEQPHQFAQRTASYLGRDLRNGQTVFGAMCETCHVPKGDFRIALHPDWLAEADKLIAQINPKKPIMIYRPLLNNHSRKSVSSRNPDSGAYSDIYAAIKDKYHVISVAAIGHSESIISCDKADSVFHHGEIAITTLVALMSKADLIYTAPGMGLVLAAGLGAKVIGVFGGYEDAHNYEDTMVYGPSLLIDCIHPCRCMSDAHNCNKAIDVPNAINRAKQFCGIGV